MTKDPLLLLSAFTDIENLQQHWLWPLLKWCKFGCLNVSDMDFEHLLILLDINELVSAIKLSNVMLFQIKFFCSSWWALMGRTEWMKKSQSYSEAFSWASEVTCWELCRSYTKVAIWLPSLFHVDHELSWVRLIKLFVFTKIHWKVTYRPKSRL